MIFKNMILFKHTNRSVFFYLCKMKTREVILRESFLLFLHQGYKEVSINKIINACELSKGAFYHHFSSKEDLYTQVLNRFFFNYFQSSNFIFDPSISFNDKLLHFVQSFVTPYEELLKLSTRNDLLPYFRFLFQAASNHTEIQIKINRHFYKKGYYLALIIKEEQQLNGLIKEIDAKHIAHQLLSLVMGVTILDGIYDATKIKSRLTDSINQYIQLITKQNKK